MQFRIQEIFKGQQCDVFNNRGLCRTVEGYEVVRTGAACLCSDNVPAVCWAQPRLALSTLRLNTSPVFVPALRETK